MTSFVLDTNVLVVANERSAQASAACVLEAVKTLLEVRDSGTLVLDLAGEILREYAIYCSFAGQPGVGDEFFRWVVDHRAMLATVALTEHVGRRFEEFPADDDLAAFDWSDRVFVAVALRSPNPSQIVNAVDSDYKLFRAALSRNGVAVHEICPNELKD